MDEWERRMRDHQRQRNLGWLLRDMPDWKRVICLLANRLGVGWDKAFDDGWELGSGHGAYYAAEREREKIKREQGEE